MSDASESVAKPQRVSYIVHVISHVRWPREGLNDAGATRLHWVSLIDNLLALCEADARYRSFMFDGASILVEDYLALRPDRFDEVERAVADGHLLIGPWYTQPASFLCGGEALLRNLSIGMATARVFGNVMAVGYLPAGMGQIGQMPQILRGFGIEAAAITHGLNDEPSELFWDAPDGSRVLLAHLREGYGALSRLPNAATDQSAAIGRLRDRLAPHVQTGHLAIFDGGEGRSPLVALPDAIGAANATLADTLFHSTLVAYLEAIRGEIQADPPSLPIVRGELRSTARQALGVGRLSARGWLKQRNQTVEMLLTRWVEPFAAWAELIDAQPELPPLRLARPRSAIGRAWRLLLENQTADSLGGAVIDAVADEIGARFDGVERLGEALVDGALRALADNIDTTTLADTSDRALIVFNPGSAARTDLVDTWINLPAQFAHGLVMRDEAGNPIDFTTSAPTGSPDLNRLVVDRAGLEGARPAIENGRLLTYAIRDVARTTADNRLVVIVTVADDDPSPHAVAAFLLILDEVNANGAISEIDLRFRRAESCHLRFVANDVPPLGYALYRLVLPNADTPKQHTTTALAIQNVWLRATLDSGAATITLTDRMRGLSYRGLLDLRCEGDSGDAYNFNPIGRAIQINQRIEGTINQSAEAYAEKLAYRVVLTLDPAPEMNPPAGSAATATTELAIDVVLTLLRDVPRLDVAITVHNPLANHRVRVRLPTPFSATEAQFDGAFEIVTRPIADWPPISPPEGWAETPLGTVPTGAFVAVFAPEPPRDLLSGDESFALVRPGLLVANRGLPETEVYPNEIGNAEIAVTVLRSVGSLRRAELLTRAKTFGTDIPMPGLAMLGDHTAELSILTSDSGAHGYAEARAFSEGSLRAVLTGAHPGDMPPSGALISASVTEFVISAAKLPEDAGRDGLIVRGYNSGREPIRVTLTPWRRFAHVEAVRLDESATGGRLATEADGSISFNAAGSRILTFWFHD